MLFAPVNTHVRGWVGLVSGILIGVMVGVPVSGFQSLITINQVLGLPTELSLRPKMGTGYFPGGVAFVDSGGNLGSISGNASFCVTVAGGAVSCSTSVPNFVDSEVLLGIVNGANAIFSLSHVPNPLSSLHLFRNGQRTNSSDYSVNGLTITFIPVAIPNTGDSLLADYRY